MTRSAMRHIASVAKNLQQADSLTMRRPASLSREAFSTIARAAKASASLSASMAWIIWKSAMGLPNWRRSEA